MRSASDGRLGTVSDFLFDDARWMVRWLVVDTGTGCPAARCCCRFRSWGTSIWSQREFSVRLTKQQVKNSPDVDSERPVSRQMETSVYDYYGWRPYWGSGFYMGGYGYDGDGYWAGHWARIRAVETARFA